MPVVSPGGLPRTRTIYLVLWLPIALLVTGVFTLAHPGDLGESIAVVLPLTLLLAFQSLSARWVARATPLGRAPLGRVLVTAGAAALASALVWLGAGAGWTFLLARSFDLPAAPLRFRGALALFFAVATLIYLLALALFHLLDAAERTRAAEKEALAAALLAREAEIKALKAQLDPHFLFNSLNSVSALIGSDPSAARRMCLLMAGFFRKSLGLGRRVEIPLSEELYLAETFLAIEQVRFGDRLRVVTEIGEETLTLAVPPLILQPLVENAVHHGIAHLIEGGEVILTARREGDRMLISVANPCDPERPPSRGAGVGLANVRARLAVLFGSAGQLEVESQAERFLVRLWLPARPSPSS